MWKKLLVACIAFMGLCTVVFARNSQMFAQPVSQPLVYYGAGDTFERTNLNYFTMGGVNWRIVYANTGTTVDGTLQPGEGYIMASDVAIYEDGSLVYVFSCANAQNNGYEIRGEHIDACLSKSQAAYTVNLLDPMKNDDMSPVFKNNNALTTLSLMTLQDYDTITKVQGGVETQSAVDEFIMHEKNGISGAGDTWLKDLDGTDHILFWKSKSGYSTYDYLSSWAPTYNTISSVRPIFKIQLPQKGIIKSISYTPDPNVNLYANTIMTKPGAKLGDIDTDEGVGPYEFTIESGTTTDKDVDVNGNLIGAGKTLSTNFSLAQDTTNGTAELLVGNTPLAEGTYYVKVKVKDKVNNPRLYYDVDDPYREKSVVIEIVVTHDMKNITFTPDHHGITTTNITDLYTSTIGSNIGNVSELDEIGEAKVTGGAAPITFDIVSSSNSNDISYQNFEIKTVNNVSKVVVKQGVNAQKYLDPGVYTFRVRAYDKNNDVADYTTPSNTKPINNSFQPVSNLKDQNGNAVTYGLVSDDITIVVYPSEHFISYSQEKDQSSNTYYKANDLNTLSTQTKLGEISFAQVSKLAELDQGGYSLRDVQLVKHNTTTEISELDAILPVGQIQDPYELEIRKKNNSVTFNASTITFDILVTFAHQGTGDVAQIRLENQKFIIPGSLQFYDSTGAAKNEFEVTFDPVTANNNKSVIFATDDASATPQANANVKYCILDMNGDCEANSPTTIAEITPYNQIITGGSAGKISVEAKGPGTTEKEVTIRAMLMDSTGTVIQTYADAVFKVKPAKQILTWEGDGVTQASASTDTWEVSLPWSGGTDTYTIDELLNSAARTNKLAIKNNIASGATTSIKYTLGLRIGPTDAGKVTISNVSPYTLTITGSPQQTVYIEAERAGDLNYGPSAVAKLKLNISQLPVLSFTYDQTNGCSNAMTSGTTCTKASDTLGKLSIAPTVTNPSYSLVKAEQSLDDGQSYRDTALNTFLLNTSNGEVKVKIGTSNLTNGKYKLTFGGSDGTNTLANIEVIFTVGDASFDTSSWVWKAGDINALQQVGTGVDPTTKENDATYQRTYAPKTNTNPATSPDKFQAKLEGLPSGASVTYSLKQTTPAQTAISKTSGTTNSFDVLSTGGGSGTDLMIQADVTMSGYASTTVYLPIEIVKYTQTIAFDTTNPVTIYLPDNAPCTSITAKKTSTYYDTTTPITYSTTGSTFTINANNEVCPVAMPSGTVAGSMTSSETLDASLASSTNYTSASATQNIIIYKPGSIDVSKSIETVQGAAGNITYTPYANASDMSRAHAGSTATQKNGYKASTNDIVGQVKLTGINGDPTESYKKSANPTTTSANRNANMFTVNSATGSILLTQDVTARDIVNQGGNIFYLQVDVKDYLGYTQTVDVQIKIESAIPDFYFTDVTGTKLPTNASLYVDNTTSVPQYVFTFAKNGNVAGTFDIFTNRSDAILSEDTTTGVDLDVIEYQSGNQFDMVHATDEIGQYGGTGGKAYVKAHVNAGAGYTAMDIYAEVKLERAPQPDFAFATSSIHIAKSSSGIVPTYVGHLDSGDVTITASNDPTVAVAGNYTPGSDQEITPIDVGGPASITAHAPGDRDFLPADASVDVYVSEHPTTTLTLHVNQPIYYGDTGKIATIISGYKSNLPAYFSSSDPTIVSIQDTNTTDNKADLTILKPGRVDIEVCQTDKAGFQAGDPCPGSGAEYGITTIQIYPRPLKVKLQDETIYKGEGFPVYALETSPIGGTSFVGNDSMQDIPLPASTSARDRTSVLANTNIAGDYPIQGSYSSAELATIPILQNYKVTIVDGNLKIVEDPSSASWYHLEGADTGATLSPNDWHNEDVYIKLDTASGSAGSYDQISNTDAFANMDKTKFLVMDEDKTTPDVYFRIDPNGGSAHAGAIAEKQTALVKIDKTDPKVTGAKGTPSNKGIFAQLMNTLTFHTFFKPGVEIVIQTSDPQPAGSARVVEVSGVKSVDYTVYEVDEKTGVIKTEVTPITGSGSVGSDGAFSFHIPKVGTYKVCAIAHDNAGNDSVESCYYANVKKIDVDGDGDGDPDFNDPDGDGCPDLNIILGKDSDGDDIKLNVAKKGESKPYLNIDTDGDGKPDINVDTDKDGKLDLNIMTVTSWNPTKCVTGQIIEYCTDGTLIPNINVDIQGDGPGTPPDGRPDINIDLDGDGIPDIDIDTDGDGIPDINVDTNRDGTPDEKVKKLDKWVIDPSIFEANGKKFQTMTGIEPDVIDEIRDGDFILVPSEGTHFQPGYTLVIDDITGTMDDGTRTNINTQVPGGQEIKYVYDVQLWDGTKHIQPDGRVKVKIPTIDGIENPKLVLEQPDGTYITVDAVIEDGHYVYETDFLGKVSVIGDKQTDKDPTPTDPVNTNTKEPVKGAYTSSIGGALTGDRTQITGYILILIVAGMCITILCKQTHEKR